MTRLEAVQTVTQQIAEAISSVLDMAVTIVDENMVRIAGTGCHEETIGEQIQGNTVYSRILREGSEYLIKDVSTSHACTNCGRRGSCVELAQFCCPIYLGKETIGVIGLVAFSPEQQQELVKRSEYLLKFMRKMAELVAAKVLEVEAMQRTVLLKKQLETVLNFVTEGVIAIDQQARISCLNYAAEKLLRLKESEVVGYHISEVFAGTPLEDTLRDGTEFVDREVKLWQRGHEHHYYVSAKPIVDNGIIQGVVASFRPAIKQAGRMHQVAAVAFTDLIGESAVFKQVLADAQQAAPGNCTILIGGESGTGKEVLAKAIHFASSRKDGPFVAVNCAAIPETLLESELYGYEEGSFTGAKRGGKLGKFQLAHGGTLLLDEIGDMPLLLQVKLLRVIQDRIVEPVGSAKGIPVDVRIVAASNRDLRQLVEAGLFREDLYYRINVIQVVLPPLRRRQEDILLLARKFLKRLVVSYDKNIVDFESDVLHCLQNYEWPGNVRELENTIECAVVKAEGAHITPGDLPERLLVMTSDLPERNQLAALLEKHGLGVDGKKAVAVELGISLATLYRKIKKYNL